MQDGQCEKVLVLCANYIFVITYYILLIHIMHHYGHRNNDVIICNNNVIICNNNAIICNNDVIINSDIIINQVDNNKTGR